ncbi:hypothetical protein GQ42DRAFT_178300 [Ramicandelaber brevisporus]|nr:hypothetical protein GQ42DRAFT_178300 [Ramicandelaber brevisporus]
MKVKSPTASATTTATSTDGTVLAIPLTAAPVEAVTVYGRNALIRRVIHLESLGSTPAGTTLLRLRGVSGQLITDSLRVSAASPGLTILDVNARSFYATGRELDYLYNLALDGTSNVDGNDDDSDSDFDADEAVDPKTLPLRKQVAITEKHVGKLKAQVDRMGEERSLFKAFMNKACHADASGGSLAGAVGSFTAGSGVSSERAISSIQDMLGTYRSKAAQYDDEYEALRSKWSKAEKRLERLKERKRQQDELDRLAKQAFGPLPSGESSGGPQSRAGHVLHGTKAHDRVQMTEITIKVDAAEAEQQQQQAASQSADIVVEYLVSSAGWKPVYDLRASAHRHSVNVVLHYNIPWTTDDRVAVGNVRVAQYSSDTGLRGPLQAVKFPFMLLAGDGGIKSPSDISQASVTELHEPRKARDSKNAIRWVLPLDAGQTLKWSISFEVEHPTSQNLQGL